FTSAAQLARRVARIDVRVDPATSPCDAHSAWLCGRGAKRTRTRDLRRDRTLPSRAAIGGDYRHEQGLSTLMLRGFPGAAGTFRRPPAGSVRMRLLSEPRLTVHGAVRELTMGWGRRQLRVRSRAQGSAGWSSFSLESA